MHFGDRHVSVNLCNVPQDSVDCRTPEDGPIPQDSGMSAGQERRHGAPPLPPAASRDVTSQVRDVTGSPLTAVAGGAAAAFCDPLAPLQ